jgi:hypothetical protein
MPQDNSMPLIDLTLRHGQTLEEARRRLEIAVNEVNTRFASMIRRTDWAVDHSRVKVEGAGFWLEMSVDAQSLHATGDIPILGRLLGSQFVSGLKQIVERTFQKKLPP